MVRIPGITKSGPNGTAKRLRNNAESVAGKIVMTTVVCYQCGARFAIAHSVSSPDQDLARRQATWLADRFVWDHIQESNHHGSIDLPASGELK